MEKCAEIINTRIWTEQQLKNLGFTVLPSNTNFLFAKTDKMDGGELYEALKAEGILVRHFTKPTIANFCRITIGTREQMDVLLEKTKRILAEKGC